MQRIQVLCGFVTRSIAFLVLGVALLAFVCPSSFNWITPKCISYLLGAVMLGMGVTIRPLDFKVVFTHPREVLVGCAAQFLCMPLISWFIVSVFDLPDEWNVGVILVGACPGGTASNVITYLAGGDLALSVGMTCFSTLLSPLATPFIVWVLAGSTIDVNVLGMWMSIMQVVIFPLLLGMLLRRFFPRFTEGISDYLPSFSVLCIMLIVGIVVASNSGSLHSAGSLLLGVVVLQNMMGYLLGYVIGVAFRLSPPRRIAVCVEVGMQNSGLACSLAAQHFALMPMAAIPGALFSVWHNISGAFLSHLFVFFRKKYKK